MAKSKALEVILLDNRMLDHASIHKWLTLDAFSCLQVFKFGMYVSIPVLMTSLVVFRPDTLRAIIQNVCVPVVSFCELCHNRLSNCVDGPVMSTVLILLHVLCREPT